MSYGYDGVVLVGNMPGPTQGWAIRKQQDDTYSSVPFIDGMPWLTSLLEYQGSRYPANAGRAQLGLWTTPWLGLRWGKSTDEIELTLIPITPHLQVTLGVFELPREEQLWKFIPIPE